MKTRTILAALIVTTATAVSPLRAQSAGDVHPWLEDDFILGLGGFLPSKEFKLRVDGEIPGREIDFNEGVAVSNDETTGALQFRWNFGEKWSFAGQYWSTDDDGNAVLTEDITWRDNVLKAGSNVGAGIGLDVARLLIGRKFFTDEGDNHEFGMGLGLHWLQIDAYLEGEFFVNDQTTGFKREQVTADLPLPNFNAWYLHSFSPRWLLVTHLDWLSASIGDYSGSLWNVGAGINFQAWENVGFGLSYQLLKIDVDINKSDWHGKAEVTQDGPFLSATFNW